MRQSTRVLYIIVTLCLGLAASTAVLADATTTKLFYTKFSGSPNVKSVDLTYDGVTMTLATPVVIGTTTGADGITGNPQNSDLLIVGGQNNASMNTISISTGTATIYPSPVNVFHLEIADPTTIYGSGIPGALSRHTINPDGSLSAGTVITLSGPDTTITQIITTPVGFFYTSSGSGGNGNFGTLAFTGATATTTRLLSSVPAAHGGVYDPLTNTIILMGNAHLTQFNLAGAQIADLDFVALGLNFGNFDQGTVDGAGHLFVAQNSGDLTFVDYSAAAGGLIDDPGNFIDVQFLDANLDDIAPLVGSGGIPRCDPDPRTQGYWHRQCLGIPGSEGGIDPGRNGRGPSEPIEPDFQNVLMPAVDVELQNSLFLFGGTCQDGIDADPPSDPCEKAIKQFTAMLLNVESDRLQDFCEVDLSAQGCSSTNIADLVAELASLIVDGDCQEAAECAEAVNEGGGIESVYAASTTAPVTATLSGSTLSGAALPETVVITEPTAEPVSSPAASIMVLSGGSDVVEPEAPVVADEDPLDAIQRHLMILAGGSSLEEDLEASTDALLTALSGGYELEMRLAIAKRLVENVDVSLHSLLAAHLEDIRSEAEAFDKLDLVQQAARLLKGLEPGE